MIRPKELAMSDEQEILYVLARIESKLNDIETRLKSVEMEVKRVKNEARGRG